MLVQALKSFAGKISMYVGEIREIKDEEIIKDLTKAKYIREVKAKAEKIEVRKPTIEEPKAEEPKKARKTRRKK